MRRSRRRRRRRGLRGVTDADIDDGFEGHRICDLPSGEVKIQSSLTAFYERDGYVLFHPTREGQRSMVKDFERWAYCEWWWLWC